MDAGDKWGYVNNKGEEVISPVYDGALEFSDNGLAAVKSGDKWGYINKKGEFYI